MVRKPDANPYLVELVAALSLATDLGLGQPLEHGLRSCLIASGLAETMGLGEEMSDSIFWVTLLAMVGCTADSSMLREDFGDDIEFRRGMYGVGPSQTEMPRYLLSRAGSDGGPIRRVAKSAALVTTGMQNAMTAFMSDCEITGRFAERLGFDDTVSTPLQQKFARWDGNGLPKGLGGESIPFAARMLGLSWRTEAAHRERGTDTAVELLRRHAGATLDPKLVEACSALLPELLAGLDEDPWGAIVAGAPARARLTGDALDSALEALGDFADLKSPFFTGHSAAVAELAEAAGWRAGLEAPEVDRLRRSALVHSLGRTGVSNAIWDKPGSLSISERERMQLYPYLTGRILDRGSLAPLAEIASQVQERMDGSGYPRGLRGTAIPPASRILAAAHVYRSLREERPHRGALDEAEAMETMHAEVTAGRLDQDATEAVLAALGQKPKRRRSAPDALTAREVEVLRLIARGLTSARAAERLGISRSTVNTHVEHIYEKIGASGRAVATLYAMENGLV